MEAAALRIEGLDPPLQPGQVLALLGLGAEAALLALAGFAPATNRLWLGERELTALPPHRRGLATVLGEPGLFPALSVAENIVWPLRCPAAERPARLAAALAALELEPLAQRAASRLSPAQAGRVALARALAQQPGALLLQEPFAALGAAEAEALALRLRELGPPVVLATARAPAALSAAHRLAALHQGQLLQAGTPAALYARPADARVAALTGEANFLPGTVLEAFDDEGRIRLEAGAVVEAMFATPLPAGARCQVMLRPEALAVAAVDPASMGEGALAATLVEAVFQGGQVRLRLALAGGATLLARRAAGLRLPALGEPCAVAWNTAHALVFPA